MAGADQGPPQTFVGLCELLATHKASMARRIRQAATFVIGHPDDVAFQPVAVLAARAGTHPSAFVRLAQEIGYDGFSQMQAIFRRRLVSPEHDGRRSDRSDALSRLAEHAQDLIARLDERIDRMRLGQAADALAKAQTVFLVGRNHAHFATSCLSQLLTASGVRNMAACGGLGTRDRTLTLASPHDVAVVMDVLPPDPLVASQAADLRDRRVPLIVLTDSRMHPLAGPDVIWFEAFQDAASGFCGWGTLECLGMALVHGIRSRRAAAGPDAGAPGGSGAMPPAGTPVGDPMVEKV